MKRMPYRRTMSGFTKSRKVIVEAIKKFKKEFFCQNHYTDAIKFITDCLDRLGYIDNSESVCINKYTLVNRLMVNINEVQSLEEAYQKDHVKPNPQYSYDYSGLRDLEDYYCSL